MTKVAVYGFVRIVFDLVGQPAWWWSILVIALAGITCVLGVLSALMQHDLKRLLAYHTVENIGIIFIGLGLALAFSAHGMQAPAALALTAALFHVLQPQHLQEPAVLRRRRRARPRPASATWSTWAASSIACRVTAFAFLAGCMAISALPPLNGFVSEWLTFQAILLSPALPALGPQDHRAGGRCHAGAVRGAGRGLLRQGLRRHLPRPAAHAGGGAGARGRSLPRSPPCWRSPPLPAGRHPARPLHRRARRP